MHRAAAGSVLGERHDHDLAFGVGGIGGEPGMVRPTGAVFRRAGFPTRRGNPRSIEALAGAIGHHLAQALPDLGQRGGFHVHLGAPGGSGPVESLIGEMGRHQPTAVGKHGVGAR